MGVTLFFAGWAFIGMCAYFSVVRKHEHEDYQRRMKQMQDAHNRSLRKR